jgi:hypothetical protein
MQLWRRLVGSALILKRAFEQTINYRILGRIIRVMKSKSVRAVTLSKVISTEFQIVYFKP